MGYFAERDEINLNKRLGLYQCGWIPQLKIFTNTFLSISINERAIFIDTFYIANILGFFKTGFLDMDC